MITTNVQAFGHQLRRAIETGQPTENIGQCTQDLVAALGGDRFLYSRDPGTAALYIVALMCAKGEQ